MCYEEVSGHSQGEFHVKLVMRRHVLASSHETRRKSPGCLRDDFGKDSTHQ